MGNVDRLLDESMYMCKTKEEIGLSFKHRMYPFATENISGFIKSFDLADKSLLTVGSSGDQVINAVLHGCKDVTLLDIVPDSVFYYYLKVAGLLCLSRKEFLEFFRFYNYGEFKENDYVFNKTSYNKFKSTLKSLDHDSYKYFDVLFSCFDGRIVRGALFGNDEETTNNIIRFNDYLQSDSLYEETRNKIKDIRPIFIPKDIFNIDNFELYDNIWLSNIPAWYEREEDVLKLAGLTYSCLDTYGKLLFSYLYKINDPFSNHMSPVYDIKNIKKLLSIYNPSIIEFDGVAHESVAEFHRKDGALILSK